MCCRRRVPDDNKCSIYLRAATILIHSSLSVASIRGWPLSGVQRLFKPIRMVSTIRSCAQQKVIWRLLTLELQLGFHYFVVFSTTYARDGSGTYKVCQSWLYGLRPVPATAYSPAPGKLLQCVSSLGECAQAPGPSHW